MYSLDSLKQYANEIGCVFSENEPMNLHTSFKIGGTADIAMYPSNDEMLACIVHNCNENEIPYHIIGNGSNILVADSGIRGAVIFTSGLADIKMIDAFTIECGAGVKTSQLCMFALEHSLSGFEFLWGIPGTVGGAAYMNAGAYGGEMSDIIVNTNHIDENAQPGSLQAEDIDLSYRHSAYQTNGYIITSVRMRGTASDMEQIRTKMDELMNRRKEKQPLEFPSAGSTFKRPENNYAAALIEECGLKGKAVGGAMVSEKHAGFIINTGNASASDVKILIEQIKQEVFLQKDIQLECEVRMVE